MAGYERPNGGYTYSYQGVNTVESADHLDPTQYPLGINIRALPDHHVETRPGYAQMFTINEICPDPTSVSTKTFALHVS